MDELGFELPINFTHTVHFSFTQNWALIRIVAHLDFGLGWI